jgi:hypothetical protein
MLQGALPSVPSLGSQRVWGYQGAAWGDPEFAGADRSLLSSPFVVTDAVGVDALLDDLLPLRRRE